MDQESAKSLSDRELLVHTAVAVGVLEERTEGLPEMRQRLTKVESDVGWIKRLFWGWVVPSTLSFVGIFVKLYR